MLARLLAIYPTASLSAELLQIHQGKFVVRASVQVDGVTRATGLAAAGTLELAEDRARSRALMVLLPDASSSAQPEISAQYPTVALEVQPVVKQSLPSLGADNQQPSSFATASCLEWLNKFIISSSANGRKINIDPKRSTQIGSEKAMPLLSAVTPVAHAEEADEPSDRRDDAPSENGESVVIPFSDDEPAGVSGYSHESNLPEPQITAAVNGPFDLSDAIAQTSIQLNRLGWDNRQGRKYLEQTYGKRSRHELSDSEMLSFLAYLESQPTPNQLPLA